jgi:myo-inositol-1(or 4)-monophosphatase
MYQKLRTTAMDAARLAGQEALRFWRRPHNSRFKGPRDIVTEADVAAERAAVALISSAYPRHAIMAEEGGAVVGDPLASRFKWIIDPIDGTTNYARNLPIFTVSVAVARNGRPIAGALYEPLSDQMYHAARGEGAFCGDRPLTCSARDQLDDFLIGVDWPRDEDTRSRMMQATLVASPRIGGWRSLGSAALGIAMVGAGILDAYVHAALHAWDMAAAALIVEMAGGRVTGLNGSPRWWNESTCLASNGLAHGELLEMFQSVVSRRAV